MKVNCFLCKEEVEQERETLVILCDKCKSVRQEKVKKGYVKRRRLLSRRYYKKNKSRLTEQQKEYRKKNPEIFKEAQRKYKAIKMVKNHHNDCKTCKKHEDHLKLIDIYSNLYDIKKPD